MLRLIFAIAVLVVGDTPAVAKPRTVLDSLRPAPPSVRYTQGTAPGLPQNAMGTAAYSADEDTVYYQGILDPATKAHETGHAFDDQILSDGDRRFFQRTMGMPDGEWRTGTGLNADGLKSPSEWFADYYAAAVLGLDPERQSEAAYAQIGPKRLARFSAALDRLGRRQGLKSYTR